MGLDGLVLFLVISVVREDGSAAVVSMSTDVYLVSLSPKGGSSFLSSGTIKILMTYTSSTPVTPRTWAKRFFTLSKTFVAEAVSRVRGILRLLVIGSPVVLVMLLLLQEIYSPLKFHRHKHL